MLTINVEKQEFYDDVKEVFFYTKPIRVQMEHSLISVSKWEAVWEKAYLPTKGVVPGMSGFEEERHYISCMIVGKVPKHIPNTLFQNFDKEISAYINSKQSATTIHSRGGNRPPSRQVVTAEVIYYWMIKFNVPFSCERWHLNRLLTFLDVCNVKENTGKGSKLSSAEALNYQQQLNQARRAGL